MEVYLVIPRLTHQHALALNFTEDILELPKLRRNMFFHVTLILLMTNMDTWRWVDISIKEAGSIMTGVWTLTHMDLASSPINLRIMLSQPIITQDDQSVRDS